MHGPRVHGRDEDAASIRKRVTKIAKAGRVTPEEAERVLAAADGQELERAVGEIRVRHARARLGADVKEGRLTKKEADLFVERLSNGEDPRPPSRFGRPSQGAAARQTAPAEPDDEPLGP